VTDEVAALPDKGDQNLASARLLTEHGFHDVAASRAYHPLFYAAQALLLTKGLSFSRHSAVIAAIGEHFAKPRLLEPELHRELIRAFEQRRIADYRVAPRIGASEADRLIARAERFLAAAREFLGAH